MHWSKSRHVDYKKCPRKFFYTNIAAQKNKAIKELTESISPPLMRHEAVRTSIAQIAKNELFDSANIEKILSEIEIEF